MKNYNKKLKKKKFSILKALHHSDGQKDRQSSKDYAEVELIFNVVVTGRVNLF